MNNWIAKKSTLAFGTMWAFYVFVIYGLTPLMWPQYMDHILYWSNFIQLIALPLLAVGTRLLGESGEKRAQQDHEALMSEVAELKEMHKEIHSITVQIHDGQSTQSRKIAEHFADAIRRVSAKG